MRAIHSASILRGDAKQMPTELTIQTRNQTELVDITSQVQGAVKGSSISQGLCHIFVPHTTAGLTLNENWDPAVRGDIIRTLNQIVPRVGDYRHSEGNSPAHIKAMLTGFTATLFVERSQLVLGTWQGIYLAEFDGPRRRRVLVGVTAT
jgi:secondary thiamine-phosphate synthase enzyme